MSSSNPIVKILCLTVTLFVTFGHAVTMMLLVPLRGELHFQVQSLRLSSVIFLGYSPQLPTSYFDF